VATLFEAHYVRLVRLARHLLDDPAQAEDLAMDAFASLAARWSRVQEPELAYGYLRACVVNASRSRLRHRLVALRHVADVAREESTAGADEAVIRALVRSEVASAVRALPLRQRQVVVLRYYEELSEAEIAVLLGCSAGSVKTHASRALRTVAARIGERI
jgi:RNA polymerase sigma-70 factor (sigma-E family)